MHHAQLEVSGGASPRLSTSRPQRLTRTLWPSPQLRRPATTRRQSNEHSQEKVPELPLSLNLAENVLLNDVTMTVCNHRFSVTGLPSLSVTGLLLISLNED